MNNQKPKIMSLQALRAIAILGIFTCHCEVNKLGTWGVSVFVMLSGFLMYYSYNDRELDSSLKASFKFSVNHVKKLYPLHLIMMLTATLYVVKEVVTKFSINNLIIALAKLLLNILLLQDWVPNIDFYFSFNGVAWYLSLILFLYFCFPKILKAIKRINSNKTAGIAIIAIYFTQIVIAFLVRKVDFKFCDGFRYWFTYIFPVFRLGDFTIGCCVGYIYKNSAFTLSSTISTIAEVAVIIVIVLSESIFSDQIGILGSAWFRYNMLFSLSSACAVFLVAKNQGLVTKVLSNKILVHIGEISSYIFLIHQMVIRYFDTIFCKYMHRDIIEPIKTLILLIIVLVASEVYYLFEKKVKQLHANCV